MVLQSIHLKDHEGIWQAHQCIRLTQETFSRYKINAVSMIDAASWKTSGNSTVEGFCHQRFQPNLVIDIHPGNNSIKADQKLGISDARLLVMKGRHRCHRNCPLFEKQNSACIWTESIHYATVLQSGMICVNDPVVLDPID
jgi:MOSC domain-containing protein YiiM